MSINPPFGIAIALIAIWTHPVMADAESNPESAPSGQIFIPPVQAPAVGAGPSVELSLSSVEVWNNSNFPIYLTQAKMKQQTLPSKQKSSDLSSDKDPEQKLSLDLNQGVISLTPATKDAAIKFVTLTPQSGACKKASYCLIVQ
ncbi:hypothetical protein [Pseudomonas rhodesiae]|uniref:Uncharacterized protein n=1 Tax=Pseudomonas rhodesiae TaxID=76760 RepID=A0AAE8HFT9_9PSED|nr:hypothetical protein [Pseudomonas rhodesiae]ROM55572.1 hypothetical protein BK650_11845 [Pseudomonas rhodesiae]ROM65621.1 hypothetical protein BK651_09850 [Pseudomonas rhodesiae]TWR58645.1 hypothetical protein FIV35_01910 [Pseudomonas rhodesiae]SDV14213.1 hypothetical protein SAMN04490209_4355 [Pseudomonas rhodesiae]